MADDHASTSAATLPGPSAEDDSASLYAQALRFLISLQGQERQDVEAQRAFLRSKGLDDAMIERATAEARRPETQAKDGLVQTVGGGEGATLSNAEAFDRAAKAFDDPLHASEGAQQAWPNALPSTPLTTSGNTPSLPPRTYPRSPLALYQQQPNAPYSVQSTIDNPMTRYHVILRFFRSLSYFLMLGGGATGIAVALYRTYMLPRLVATLDARSSLLKHHHTLFCTLRAKVRDLKRNSLAPSAVRDEATPSFLSAQRKGVLKKVQFADEVQEKGDDAITVGEDEEKKESGEATPLLGSAKGQDAEDITATGESSSRGEDIGAEGSTDQDGAPEPAPLAPIDILQPLRNSLARLQGALKADTAASAIGTPIGQSSIQAPSASMATTVSEGDEAWTSDEDGDDNSSDELEFDPFAAPSASKTRSAKRKHTARGTSTRTATAASSSRTSAAGTSSSTLKSSLNGLNAYINTQTYMANANVMGSRSLGFGVMGGSLNPDGKQTKPGDVAQVRAEIRSLKGLLLSRRNFPVYNRPLTSTPNEAAT